MAQVGLEDQRDRLNRTLSGGMKRKVLVAMVLASDAEFVFLDEPSTGLDPISRQDLWKLLIELGKERFVFLTTHYLEEAESVADRIGILERRQVADPGQHGRAPGAAQAPVQPEGPEGRRPAVGAGRDRRP